MIIGKELPGLSDLPIYIELNKFASSRNSDLLDYASSNWKERYDIPKKRHYSASRRICGMVFVDNITQQGG